MLAVRIQDGSGVMVDRPDRSDAGSDTGRRTLADCPQRIVSRACSRGMAWAFIHGRTADLSVFAATLEAIRAEAERGGTVQFKPCRVIQGGSLLTRREDCADRARVSVAWGGQRIGTRRYFYPCESGMIPPSAVRACIGAATFAAQLLRDYRSGVDAGLVAVTAAVLDSLPPIHVLHDRPAEAVGLPLIPDDVADAALAILAGPAAHAADAPDGLLPYLLSLPH